MKWEDKKRIDIHNDEDVYQLLNSPASNFYAGAFYFVNYADFTNKMIQRKSHLQVNLIIGTHLHRYEY